MNVTKRHFVVDKSDLLTGLIVTVAVICTIFSCTGCGHNVIQYGDGVGFDFGISPENYSLSFNLRYGKILSAVTRDNVELEMSGKVQGDGKTSGTESTSGSGTVSTDGALKVKIGRQINGAAVNLVKAGADPNKVLDVLKDKETAAATTATATAKTTETKAAETEAKAADAKDETATATPAVDTDTTTTKESEASK